MWGPYPALVDARPWIPIPGVLFEAGYHDRYEHLHAKLQAYEGANYKPRICMVNVPGQEGAFAVDNGIAANTFQWIGDPAELQAKRGFDLKDYQMSRVDREKEEKP